MKTDPTSNKQFYKGRIMTGEKTVEENQQSETPRTDDLDSDLMSDADKILKQGGKASDVVNHTIGNLFKSHRNLERELTAAKLEIKGLKAQISGLELSNQDGQEDLKDLKQDHDNWKQLAEKAFSTFESSCPVFIQACNCKECSLINEFNQLTQQKEGK